MNEIRKDNLYKTNVLDYLEMTVQKYPERTAVDDGQLAFTWKELESAARTIGSALSRRVPPRSPVPVLMEKSSLTLAVMLGIVYAGGFYVPVNPVNPPERIKKILRVLNTEIIIAEKTVADSLLKDVPDIKQITAEQLLSEETDRERLAVIRENSMESDILYGLFTSGSTGNPKAVAVSHDAVIRFISHFTDIFGITEDDRLGNQAPFDFDVSVKDIYSSIMTGAQLILIPKKLFSTPPGLLDYLCEKKVTNLTWAVSALTLVSSLKGLDYRIPDQVKRILFSGEAMPPKQLRLWQQALPHTRFVNLYGPTEITCNCTYFPVEREYSDKEKIPIGRAFPGRRVFLLDDEQREILAPGSQGEICVAGESLAAGYYRDPEQTAKRFPVYLAEGTAGERICRTGDLGYYDEEGNLIFAGRKDFQIKHMGHRIELEEVEAAMNAADGVEKSCCVFDREHNRLAGFYLGTVSASELRKSMKEKLPVYMVPAKIIQTPVMPLNKNGKTDRAYFMVQLQERRNLK